jgi:hypothetical protein
MRIVVTRDHIAHGVPGTTGCCALALAVQDTSGDKRAWVGHTLVAVWGVQRDLPLVAYNFRERFDKGEQVEPFEFDIPV